jgi:hypothetical protein
VQSLQELYLRDALITVNWAPGEFMKKIFLLVGLMLSLNSYAQSTGALITPPLVFSKMKIIAALENITDANLVIHKVHSSGDQVKIEMTRIGTWDDCRAVVYQIFTVKNSNGQIGFVAQNPQRAQCD